MRYIGEWIDYINSMLTQCHMGPLMIGRWRLYELSLAWILIWLSFGMWFIGQRFHYTCSMIMQWHVLHLTISPLRWYGFFASIDPYVTGLVSLKLISKQIYIMNIYEHICYISRTQSSLKTAALICFSWDQCENIVIRNWIRFYH